jgi:hypothetical protein
MTRRSPLDDLPERYFLEAREPKGRGPRWDRAFELAAMAIMAFMGSVGGLVTAGSYIFFTQREATVLRADIANTKTDVAILSAQFHDHLSFTTPNDTPSRTASMYPRAHR